MKIDDATIQVVRERAEKDIQRHETTLAGWLSRAEQGAREAGSWLTPQGREILSRPLESGEDPIDMVFHTTVAAGAALIAVQLARQAAGLDGKAGGA